MKQTAEEQAAKAAQEAAATFDETVLPSTKVTFGAGASVKSVLTGHETCKVFVRNLPLGATRAEVIMLFTQPGFDPAKFTVVSLRPSLIDRSHLEATVEFKDPEDGKNAVAGLDDIEFGSEKLKLVVAPKQGAMGKSKDRNSHILTVSWPAPSNYDFSGSTHFKVSARNMRFYNLDEAIPSLKSQVLRAHPESYHSLTWEPSLVPNKSNNVSVKIHFPVWEHAKAVRDFLDQKFLPFCPQAKYYVFLQDPLHYTINVPYLQYKAQEKLFQSLTPAQNGRLATTRLRILANQPHRPARIELSGSDRRAVGKLKVRIEQLTAGEKLLQWDQVFYSPEGERIVRTVNNQTGAYIRVDKRQRTLKVFGEQAAVEQAKALIQEEVDKSASLQFEVFLKRASVRFFVDGARGSTLLKQEVGEDNVTLDVSSGTCKIIVRGGESARHCLHKLIDESLSDAIRSQHQLKDGEICPVCYDNIDQPYRLACGHPYCYSCLRHFLVTASDTKQFPLSCMGDEGKCGLPIPLPVIQRFLAPVQFKRLLEVSFLDHLDRNPEKFRYCTTPDCPEVYSLESDSGNGIFQCRSCFVSICVSCREDHDGFSCDEWKIEREAEAQGKLLDGWAENNTNVRKCPKCKIMIEKNGGCNHMTCPKCQAHICWRCMGVFSADTIYPHMTDAHGGMYEEPDDPFRAFEQQEPVRPFYPAEYRPAFDVVPPFRPVEPVRPIRPVQPVQPVRPVQHVRQVQPAPQVRPAQPGRWAQQEQLRWTPPEPVRWTPPPRPTRWTPPPQPTRRAQPAQQPQPGGFLGWLYRIFF